MTDIVERLRGWHLQQWIRQMAQEAADEIERLRSEKTELLKQRNTDEMQRMIDYWGQRAEKAEAEIKHLREQQGVRA